MKKFIRPRLRSGRRVEIFAGVYKMIFDGCEFYIGSTKNLNKRFERWIDRLKKDDTHNKLVSAAFKKCKEVCFEIIETTALGISYTSREDYFIKESWGNPLLLNISSDAFVRKAENSTLKIKVAQFDLQGNLIKIHNSITEASIDVFGKKRNIDKCFNRSVRTCGGFRWKKVLADGTIVEPPSFPDKPGFMVKGSKMTEQSKEKRKETMRLKPRNPNYVKKISPHAKKVMQFDLSGNLVNEFPSITSAATFMNARRSRFAESVRESPRNYYKGYIFKYA